MPLHPVTSKDAEARRRQLELATARHQALIRREWLLYRAKVFGLGVVLGVIFGYATGIAHCEEGSEGRISSLWCGLPVRAATSLSGDEGNGPTGRVRPSEQSSEDVSIKGSGGEGPTKLHGRESSPSGVARRDLVAAEVAAIPTDSNRNRAAYTRAATVLLSHSAQSTVGIKPGLPLVEEFSEEVSDGRRGVGVHADSQERLGGVGVNGSGKSGWVRGMGAQGGSSASSVTHRHVSAAKPLLIYGAAGALDLASTRYLQSRPGGREAWLPQSLEGQTAIKGLAVSACVLGDVWLQRRKPGLARVFRIAIPAVWIGAAAMNVRRAR